MKFMYRIIEDGTVESICSHCSCTTSLSWGGFYRATEGELLEVESAHICTVKS
jgi:hypothetical protein